MLDNHYVPDGYGIIPYFHLFGKEISSYSVFVGLGLLIGVLWYFLTITRKKKVNGERAYIILVCALIGGIIGSKIPVIIENIKYLIQDFSQIKAFLFTGKSIVGGLIGGYIGLKIGKKIVKEKIRIGNNITPAIALAMAIGRIGCFLSGCCYGIQTKLPIGIDFGDGITRIPTQLIEMVFCLILFIVFYQQQKKEVIPGIIFQKFVLSYFIFRFFIEFIRDTNKNIVFLSIYQVISMIGILYMIIKIRKEKREWMKIE